MKFHSWSGRCAVVIFLCCVTLLSCKKGDQGPAGPKGDKGDTGEKGATGATGTANVIYSDWIYATNFVDSIVDNSNVKVGHLYAPGLSNEMLSNGAVQVYFTFGTGIFVLPYTSFAGGKPNTINYFPGLQKIIITRFTHDNSKSVNLSTLLQYRYILIPGGVAGGRQKDVFGNLDWTDYNQVKTFFSLPD
ncbi:MAG TPA: hypothetical protein VGC22_10910 [Chitinophaga sp.]